VKEWSRDQRLSVIAIFVTVISGVGTWLAIPGSQQPPSVTASTATTRSTSLPVTSTIEIAGRAPANPVSPVVDPRNGSTVDHDCLEAVIYDSDHYTNVRRGPGTKYDIVTTVVDNEVFCVVSQQGNWWKVRTRNGAVGYMYHDRVHLRR